MKLYSLLVLVFFFACNENQKEIDLVKLDLLASLDTKIDSIKPGDWLESHKEKGQTFEQYKAINFVHPDSIKKVIYLQPVGQFSAEEFKILQFTRDYIEAFFSLKTVLAKGISDTIVPPASKRFLGGFEQLHAAYILDSVLLPAIPADAIAVMAITAKDLYPQESWAYVFGLAYPSKRIAVSSIFRYIDEPITSSNYHLCLSRLIKTSSHEIGHMFSIRHCINADCVMNGSNHMGESDSHPNHLCSECLKKIYWSIRFNPLERSKRLQYFNEQHAFQEEIDYQKKSQAFLN